MKTLEELKALKEEVENLNKKLAELSEEELKQVAGGFQTDPGKVSTCPFDTLKEQQRKNQHENT